MLRLDLQQENILIWYLCIWVHVVWIHLFLAVYFKLTIIVLLSGSQIQMER